MSIEAKVIADSISEQGIRLTTLQLKYHRFFHSEFMTHRVFSRNASSSRAIPVKKVLAQVWSDPAMPIVWGSNKAGMQAGAELTGWRKKLAMGLWKAAGRVACGFAWSLMKVGLHKQHANRILEPWQWIHVVVSSTEWKNFMELRAHPDAQPEIQELAISIDEAMSNSKPRLLYAGEWHLPYVSSFDHCLTDIIGLKKMSAARCCRVSYLKHDGERSTKEEDFELCDKLAAARPIHASPFEHQATPDTWVPNPFVEGSNIWSHPEHHGNFTGWIQNRKLIEEQFK